MTVRADRDDAVWVGLDLGTGSARAIAVSAAGQVLGRGAEPLAGRREDDRHEQDPHDWWYALARASRAALAQVEPRRISGVAADSTSGSIVLVDPNGDPLSAGVMYDDRRATDQALRANEVGEEVWSSLGYRMQPGWGLPKLLWLIEHEGHLPNARLANQAD